MNNNFKVFIVLIFFLLQPSWGLVIDKSKSQNIPVFIKFDRQISDDYLAGVTAYPLDERRQMLYQELSNIAVTSQRKVTDFLNQENIVHRKHYLINAIYVKSISFEQLEELNQFEEIEIISHSPNTRGLSSLKFETKPQQTTTENLTFIGVDKVWEEYTKGEGVIIASQDTGVDYDHPALTKQYRGYNETHDYNWHDAIDTGLIGTGGNPCGYALEEPCDDLSHGTHTLGIAVGGEGENQIGVAPNASWIACRNTDIGNGNVSSYLSCFEFFFAPFKYGENPMTEGDTSKAPHIITNSWSCLQGKGCIQDEFLIPLKVLKVSGIFVVVSSGNFGPDCSSISDSPAWHTDHSFSVGAVSHLNGEVGHFSGRGPSAYDNKIAPHIVAPGISIKSSIPGGGYSSDWYGTSMAAPHVAGSIALMWSANPKLIGEVDLTAEILKQTASPRTSKINCDGDIGKVPNNTYGYGIINVYEAVKAAIEYQP